MNSPPTARLVIVASLLVLLIVAALAVAACGKISTASGSTASPSVSPTQSASGVGTIAVTRSSNETEHTEVYLVRTDGSGLRQLTHSTTGSVSKPAWSPDGGKIAYLTGGKRRGTHCWSGTVWVVNADGSGAHQLDPSGYGQEGSVTGVDWSPDGRQLVLTRAVPGGSDLGVMYADGSGFRILNTPGGADPVWSPTGRIFFSTGDNGVGAICSVNPDGSDLTEVTLLPVRWGWPSDFSLSRDGRWLALFHTPWPRGRVNSGEGHAVYRATNGLGGENVFLEARRLATLKGENRLKFRWRVEASWFIGFPTWSPDGTRIAFVGGASAGMAGMARALYIVRLDGSGLRMVPNTDGVTDAAWQPQ